MRISETVENFSGCDAGHGFAEISLRQMCTYASMLPVVSSVNSSVNSRDCFMLY